MHYTGTIWRPPYEADSLLLEVTAGCTHHKCKFCTLYSDLPFKFRMTPMEDIEHDLLEVQTLRTNPYSKMLTRLQGKDAPEPIRRVFLTGANPFILKTYGFRHIRLHDLSSRQNILDAVEAVNMLIPQLEKLSNQLKAVGIEEELSFSLYGPLELAYIENYFVMLLMGRLNIYNQLIEKFQEIQSLIERLKKIIRLLQDKI